MRAATVLVSLAACAPAAADVVYETPGPFGGWFGLWGPTVSSSQIVGARFVPAANYTLSAIRLWFMNDAGQPGAPIRITLRADGTHADGSSIPGTQVIAEWNIECWTGIHPPVWHSMFHSAITCVPGMLLPSACVPSARSVMRIGAPGCPASFMNQRRIAESV